jgi:hypothetical protein
VATTSFSAIATLLVIWFKDIHRIGMHASPLLRWQYDSLQKGQPIFPSPVCVRTANEHSLVAEGRAAVVLRSESIQKDRRSYRFHSQCKCSSLPVSILNELYLFVMLIIIVLSSVCQVILIQQLEYYVNSNSSVYFRAWLGPARGK